MMQIDLGSPVSTSFFNGCGSLTVRLQLGKLLWQDVKMIKIITLQKVLHWPLFFRSVSCCWTGMSHRWSLMFYSFRMGKTMKHDLHKPLFWRCSDRRDERKKKVRKRDEGSCPSVMHSCYDLCLRFMCCIYLLKCSWGSDRRSCHLPSSIYTL